MNFCQGISERIENNPILLDVLLLSDAAHFLNGHVNKRNGFWASALSDQKTHFCQGGDATIGNLPLDKND